MIRGHEQLLDFNDDDDDDDDDNNILIIIKSILYSSQWETKVVVPRTLKHN